ncbi:MAG: peptide chain release factor N(5)-glutamine methyltransferase [Armatimonadota bacterium]
MPQKANRSSTISDLCRLGEERLRAASVESPILEAQLILAHVLNSTRLGITANIHSTIPEQQVRAFEELLARRIAREPLAYILGKKEFYGLEFMVRPGVMVPRCETEVLVDECTKRLKKPDPIIADIGTGTGAIAIALAIAIPDSTIYATDISPLAIEIAKCNTEKYSLESRIRIFRGNLLEHLNGLVFDAVVSNPPYIPTEGIDALQPEIKLYEPRLALDGGPDGLNYYRKLIPASLRVLKNGGFLAVEVGIKQASNVVKMFRSAGYSAVEITKDLSGIERVVVGTK